MKGLALLFERGGEYFEEGKNLVYLSHGLQLFKCHFLKKEIKTLSIKFIKCENFEI